MASGVSAGLLLVGKCLECAYDVCEAIRNAKINIEEVQTLSKLLLTMKPVLEEMGGLERGIVDKLQPGLQLLLDALADAQSIIEKMSRLGTLKSMLWYQLHRDKLRHVHDAIVKSIATIQLITTDITSTVKYRLEQLADDFKKWQPSASQSFEQILEMLDAQQEASTPRHNQVTEAMERLVEAMGMGIPQLLSDIQLYMSSESSLSSKQLQGLQLLQQVCLTTQQTLHSMWRDPADFELEQKPIGKGASGEVYQAFDNREGAVVAVKLAFTQLPVQATDGISWMLESDSPLMAAMRRELCVVARAHDFDHVCRYLGVTVLRSRPAIIMKYYERGSLAQELQQRHRGGMPVELALRIARTILCGLDQLHSAGILVLDVKPANLLLTSDEGVVLVDFGLARALMGGCIKTMTRIQGHPEYMAPECMLGDKGVSASADMWAFGATLVHMLAGVPPFAGLKAHTIMHKVADEGCHPELPSCAAPGSGLAQLLLRCFAREPQDRPSAAEALRMVEALLQPGPSAPGTPTGGPSSCSSAVDELLRCPLCRQLLAEPVMLVGSGITYCRGCIAAWLANGQLVCPATQKPLSSRATADNVALAAHIKLLATSADTASVHSYTSKASDSTSTSSFPTSPPLTLTAPSPPPTAYPPPPPSTRSTLTDASSKAGALRHTSSGGSILSASTDSSWPSSASTLAAAMQQSQALAAAVAQCSGPSPGPALLQVVELLTSAPPSVQKQAAAALWQLSEGDSSLKDSIAAAGAFAPLVRLLHAEPSGARQEAARAVAAICSGHRVNQDALAAAGAVQPLVQMLRVPEPALQQQAASALQQLCAGNEHNARSIVAAGALEVLVAMLGSQATAAAAATLLAALCPSSQDAAAKAVQPAVKLLAAGNPAVQEAAALLYALCSDHSSNKQRAAAAGVAERLALLLQAGSPAEQQAAARCLADLSTDHSGIKRSATAAGALPQLLKLLSARQAALQQEVARCLSQLVSGSKANQDAMAAAGGIAPLVRLLECSPAAVQQQAASALACLAAGQPKAQSTIAGTGALQLLVRLLQSKQAGVQQAAASAVASICADNGQTKALAAAAGAVESLLQLLQSSTAAVQESGARALAVLCSGNIRNRKLASDAGAIEPLVQLLGSDVAAVQAAAAKALAVVGTDSSRNKEAIAALGAVALLVRLLQPSSPSIVQQEAAHMLGAFCMNDRASQDSIAASGGIGPLVNLLQSSEAAVQESAARALARLATDHKRNQDRIAAAGAIAPLVQLLEFSGTAVQHAAADAIAALSKDHATNQDIIGDGGAAEPLVQLLYAPAPEVQESAAAALTRLGEGHKGNRRKIILAGAIEQLVRLSDYGSPSVSRQATKALSVFRGKRGFWKKLLGLAEADASCVLM